MMKINIIRKVAVAVIAICTLFVTSCEFLVSTDMNITTSETIVSHEKGNIFVNVKCKGNWSLYLVTIDGNDVDWARLEEGADSGVGDKSLIVLYYDKNKGTEDRTLKIVLDNGEDWVECQFTQECEYVVQGPEDPEMSVGADKLMKKRWMELPALNDPNLEYYSHSFEMKGKVYRNYTFGWSQKDYVAVWVAYPLNDTYSNGSVIRDNASVWALDPLLGNKSSAPFGGYGGRYDRGHQLPFADRKCIMEAAKQTFYGTNMTPQDPELNQNTWASLESQVRSYASKSDTTYVVTGCIVKDSDEYTKDSNNNRMTVPTGYFKAVLKYSASSTFGSWNAIAFYFKHEPCTRAVEKSDALSIDALEEMTGIDFFVNLPEMVGKEKAATIEATDPTKVAMWW